MESRHGQRSGRCTPIGTEGTALHTLVESSEGTIHARREIDIEPSLEANGIQGDVILVQQYSSSLVL